MFKAGPKNYDVILDTKNKNNISFALAFFLPNKITNINLDRVGTEISIEYSLSRARPYSVFLALSNLSSTKLNKVKQLLDDGGYQTQVSYHLVKSKKRLTIKYMHGAEGVAREISQRFMTKFNVIAKLEKMNVWSSYDIVIWIGSEVSKDLLGNIL